MENDDGCSLKKQKHEICLQEVKKQSSLIGNVRRTCSQASSPVGPPSVASARHIYCRRPTALQLQKIRDQAVPFRRPERKGKHANVFRKIVLSVLNVDDETILFSCRCRVPLVIDYKRKLCSSQINSLGSERLHWSNGMQLRPLDSI